MPGVVESLKIITEVASTRIARFAFEYARRHGRRRVTAIHKANIMKLSDGLFLDCFRRVAADYPEIVADDRIVDAACMRLVMNPETFDVHAPREPLRRHRLRPRGRPRRRARRSCRARTSARDAAIFEAVHGTAPDIAGTGKANPTALLMCAILMLRHLELPELADRVEKALLATFAAGIRTRRPRRQRRRRQEFANAAVAER